MQILCPRGRIELGQDLRPKILKTRLAETAGLTRFLPHHRFLPRPVQLNPVRPVLRQRHLLQHEAGIGHKVHHPGLTPAPEELPQGPVPAPPRPVVLPIKIRINPVLNRLLPEPHPDDLHMPADPPPAS